MIGKKEEMPLWLMGLIPEKYIYSTLTAALDMIKKIDLGMVEIDSSKWKLLLEDLR